MITAAEEPAEYSGYTPGILLMDHGNNIIAKLPLRAWDALRRWYNFPDPEPIEFVDETGQRMLVRHGSVATMIRRDLDAVVIIETNERESFARRMVDGE